MQQTVLAVKRMSEGLENAGMEEAQALAVVEAIAEGISKFSITREDVRSVVREEIAPLHARIDKLEERMDRFDERMDRLELCMGRLEERMDGLEKRMDGLEVRMDRLEVRMDGFDKRMDRLDERMDRFDARFDPLTQQVTARMDVISGRLFYSMVGVYGALTAMFCTLFVTLMQGS